MADLVPPPPELREHDGFLVLRDDLVLGGTKARVVPGLMALDGAEEFVYAGPAQGYAQLALAVGAALTGLRATFFTPKRAELLPLTRQAAGLGLQVVEVPAGRLSVLQARARSYAELTGARLLPLGLKLPGMREAMAAFLRGLPVEPAEVWVTAGSGTLAGACHDAWPEAQLCAVQVGKIPELPAGALRFIAPEAFPEPARGPAPPFPSAEFYDRKAWRFVSEHARPGALVINVGA